MLNKASRSRSDVGRTAFDFGPASERERSFPPTTRISVVSDISAAARPSGHGGGEVSFHYPGGSALVFRVRTFGHRENDEARTAPVSLPTREHRNRRRRRRRSGRPALRAARMFRFPAPRRRRGRRDRRGRTKRGSAG